MGKKSATTIKLITIIFLVIGVCFLFLPFLQMKLQFFPETSAGDNRALNQKPDFTWEGLNSPNPKTYIERYDAYFQDHYGLRNWLIKGYSYFYYSILHQSPTNLVVLGKDGYLFLNCTNNIESSISDYEGIDLFTDQDLKKLKDNLLRLKQEFENRGIKFLIVMPPNKHTIYPEKLPDNIQRGKLNRADQLNLVIRDVGIHFIDLRLPLIEKKKENSFLYYLTDTHWNKLGAFYGYQIIASELHQLVPNFRELQASEFDFTSEKIKASGDCAKMINMLGQLEDVDYKSNKKTPYQAVKRENSSGDKYWVFEVNDPKLPKAVIFRDSFSNALQPYLSEGFSRSVYFWQKDIDFNLIDKEKPDVVIYEILERFTKHLAKE